MISQKLRVSVFLSPKRAYQIAQEASLHPATLSKLLNGIEKVNPGDPRVIAIGKVVGLSEDECFHEAD